MPRWAVGLLCVLATCAGAATRSLVDPPVTLDVKDQPLSAVLAEVTRQTGVPFELPFQGDLAGTTTRPDPNLDAVRARFDPPVTLTLTNVPLHTALNRLATASGIRFASRDTGPTLTVYLQPTTPAEAGPSVTAGEYTIHLDGLRAERVRERMWAPLPRQSTQDRLRLWLSVDAPTALALRRVQGLDPAVEALLDGEPLVAAERGLQPALRYPGRGLAGDGGYALEFSLPGRDGRTITQLDARMIVATKIEELIFEFQALERPNQRLSDGEVEVTLQRWRHVAIRPTTDTASAGRQARQPAWFAELAVVRPLGESLRSRLAPWLPLGAGRRADGAVPIPGVPGGRAVPMPTGPGALDASAGLGAVLPVVVVETSTGRRLMASLTGLGAARVDDDRLAFVTTAALPEFEGEPKRLLVAVLALSEETTQLPFRFTDVDLPGAAAPAR